MRRRWALACNLFVAVMVPVAWLIMALRNSEGSLSATGLWSLRYFTVLSNIFDGLVSALFAFALLRVGRDSNTRPTPNTLPHWLFVLKYVATVCVALTFVVVFAFLGPLYGHLSLLQGANFWFHLVIPVLSILEFVCLDKGALSFGETALSMVPVALYGLAYLINILVNGVGTYPHSNDWYGFVNWGLPIGLAIFAAILLMSWVLAILLRLGKRRVYTHTSKD